LFQNKIIFIINSIICKAENDKEKKDENNDKKDTNYNRETNGIIEEEGKCSRIFEDFSKNISILNELLNTEEYKQLTNFSINLNSNKKKINKDPLTLNLNEDNNNLTNPIKATKNSKNSKNKIGKLSKSILNFIWVYHRISSILLFNNIN